MELTPLDTELFRLHQTLSELIALGLVEAIVYDGDPTTRYRALAGRPGDEDEQEEEEAEAPARSHVAAA